MMRRSERALNRIASVTICFLVLAMAPGESPPEASLAVVGANERSQAANRSNGNGVLALIPERKPFYSVTDLGTLGGTNSEAFGINNKGQIVGSADTGEYSETWGRTYRGFLYEDGKMTELGVLGRDKWSRATGINEQGVIVGESINQVGCLVDHQSFIFKGGRMSKLELDGKFYTSMGGVNDSGHYCGLGNFKKGGIRAFLFDGTLHNLGGYASTNRSEAFGINNAGDVVGKSWISNMGNCKAFLWRKGEMVNLGNLPGDYASEARDINNDGVVVGWSSPRPRPSYDPRAVIYVRGKIQNLNELIPADSGWVLLEANGINDRGQIVGTGKFEGENGDSS